MLTKGTEVVIAGGTGLIGSHMRRHLSELDVTTRILTRNKRLWSGPGYIPWNPELDELDERELSTCQVIINLAGAGIAEYRWTSAYKKRLIDSRVQSNLCLARALDQLTDPPILLSASAIGYYGYRHGNTPFHETDAPVRGDFSQQVVTHWESAIAKAGAKAQRHVMVRIGIVLAHDGGALKEMEKGFRFGVGTYFCPGHQVYSWIHIDDLCRMMIHFINETSLSGTFNATAPRPVTALELAEKIGTSKFGRKRLIGIPEWMARLLLGDRYQLLTGGNFVSSQKVEKTGFTFAYPSIGDAVSNLTT